MVGGYEPAQIALRRAIAMGFYTPELIRVLFAGNALPANQILPPGVSGHDAKLPSKSGSSRSSKKSSRWAPGRCSAAGCGSIRA